MRYDTRSNKSSCVMSPFLAFFFLWIISVDQNLTFALRWPAGSRLYEASWGLQTRQSKVVYAKHPDPDPCPAVELVAEQAVEQAVEQVVGFVVGQAAESAAESAAGFEAGAGAAFGSV